MRKATAATAIADRSSTQHHQRPQRPLSKPAAAADGMSGLSRVVPFVSMLTPTPAKPTTGSTALSSPSQSAGALARPVTPHRTLFDPSASSSSLSSAAFTSIRGGGGRGAGVGGGVSRRRAQAATDPDYDRSIPAVILPSSASSSSTSASAATPVIEIKQRRDRAPSVSGEPSGPVPPSLHQQQNHQHYQQQSPEMQDDNNPDDSSSDDESAAGAPRGASGKLANGGGGGGPAGPGRSSRSARRQQRAAARKAGAPAPIVARPIILERRDSTASINSQTSTSRTIWEPTPASTNSPSLLASSLAARGGAGANPASPSTASAVPNIMARMTARGSVSAGPSGPRLPCSASPLLASPALAAAAFSALPSASGGLAAATGGHHKATIKLIDENLHIHRDQVWRLLSDQPGCFIVGVLGRRGVGKSTVLNMLADSPDTFKVGSAPPPPSALSSGQQAPPALTTLGIDLHVTRDGLILLDSQAIVPTRRPANAATTANQIVTPSEQITMFLFSVCHIVIVVSDADGTSSPASLGSAGKDDELWTFLKRIEIIKYRADGGTGEVATIPGARRRTRRRDRGKTASGGTVGASGAGGESADGRKGSDSDGGDSDAGTAVHERAGTPLPQPAGSEGGNGPAGAATSVPDAADEDIYFPTVLFVVNRSGPDEFAPEMHARVRDALARTFRGSRLKISGLTRMGASFPRYERLASAVPPTMGADATANKTATAGDGGAPSSSSSPLPYSPDEPNLWFLPFSQEAKPAPPQKPTGNAQTAAQTLMRGRFPGGNGKEPRGRTPSGLVPPLVAPSGATSPTSPPPGFIFDQGAPLLDVTASPSPTSPTSPVPPREPAGATGRWLASRQSRFPWLSSPLALRQHLDATRGAPARYSVMTNLLRRDLLRLPAAAAAASLTSPAAKSAPPSSTSSSSSNAAAAAAVSAASSVVAATAAATAPGQTNSVLTFLDPSTLGIESAAWVDEQLKAAAACLHDSPHPPDTAAFAAASAAAAAAAAAAHAYSAAFARRAVNPAAAAGRARWFGPSEHEWFRSALSIWESVHRGSRS